MEKKTRKTIVAVSTALALMGCESPTSSESGTMTPTETITIYIGNYTSPNSNIELRTSEGAHIQHVNIFDSLNTGKDLYRMLEVELPNYETVNVYATSYINKEKGDEGQTLQSIIHLQDSARYTLARPMGVEFVDNQIVDYYPDAE